MLAASMMNVAAQPPTSMGPRTVSRPMMRPLPAISMITAMTGTARTPLMTALQNNAFTGSSGVKLRAAPIIVDTAIVA